MRQIASTIGALAACTFLLTACSPASMPASKAHQVQLTVYIAEDGVILIDGKPAGIEELKKRLVLVKQNDGAVAYSRSNPSSKPPPNAMEALQTIMDANVPIQMLIPQPGT
jgi:hypothetical protein